MPDQKAERISSELIKFSAHTYGPHKICILNREETLKALSIGRTLHAFGI